MPSYNPQSTDVVTKVETQISEFIDQSPSLTPEDRVKKIQSICLTLKETLRHGEDKAALASQTYDMVRFNCFIAVLHVCILLFLT